MEYDAEMKFVKKLLSNFRLDLHHITQKNDDALFAFSNFGLGKIIQYSLKKEDFFQLLKERCQSNTIYKIYDSFLCNYLLFQLPDTAEEEYIVIGPYSIEDVSKQEIYKIADRFQIPADNVLQLEHFYADIPLVLDESILLTTIYTLGECLWGSMDNFTTKKLDNLFLNDSMVFTARKDIYTEDADDALLSMQLLEERYEAEHKLILAVTAGQVHKAELAFTNLAARPYEQRVSNSLRNLKNYALVLNTLLRQAALAGSVHPLHIDHMSSQFARKVEAVASESSLLSLMKDMVHKYCLLVKNHSLKGYSLLIRKVITCIDADLTADLSLKTQAALLNVNPSYLSTLFKKETGSTLTEYVNRKRMEHALFLLNSTNMQIQMIAQYCGITDVNYFTKTFKKLIGKTPTEYRESLL